MPCKIRAPLYWFLAICLASWLAPCEVAFSESFEIGLDQLQSDVNLVNSNDVAGKILRDLSADSLIRVESDGTIKLLLAGSFKASADYRQLDFTLKPDRLFHSLQPVQLSDVVYALKNCPALSSSPHFSQVYVFSSELSGQLRAAELVRVELKSQQPAAALSDTLKRISECPIYPGQEAALFGEEWGRGTNFIGAGPFKIVDFKAGKSISLERFSAHNSLTRNFDAISLRNMGNASDGLTALRLGTILMFFTSDKSVAASARSDETLAVAECYQTQMIARRNLEFACNPGLDVLSIRYRR